MRGNFVFPVRRFSLHFLLWFWCGLVEGAKEPREGETTSSFFGETCCSLRILVWIRHEDRSWHRSYDPICGKRRDLEYVYRFPCSMGLVTRDHPPAIDYKKNRRNWRDKDYYQYRKMRLQSSFLFSFFLLPRDASFWTPAWHSCNIIPSTFEYIHLK